jgi:hypothetical protein
MTAARLIALAAACALAAAWALALAGCSTQHPRPIARDALSEAQTFPYYKLYWVGPSFEGHPLAAADGLAGYNANVGDSVFYGDCVRSKGIFGGGSCLLPLQVTTVLYRLHSNSTLGPQHNILVRGVPATVYDEGRSIEIYSGRVAIDIFSDTYAHAIAAARALLPLNAPDSPTGKLPPPIYCPGLAGSVDARLARILNRLPRRVCQQTRAQLAFVNSIS